MKTRDRIAQHPGVAGVFRQRAARCIVVARGGWWPALLTGRSVRDVAKRVARMTPTQDGRGRWPDLLGRWCTVPTALTPDLRRTSRRRFRGQVVSQAGAFIQVLLIDGRRINCAITQGRDWQAGPPEK